MKHRSTIYFCYLPPRHSTRVIFEQSNTLSQQHLPRFSFSKEKWALHWKRQKDKSPLTLVIIILYIIPAVKPVKINTILNDR